MSQLADDIRAILQRRTDAGEVSGAVTLLNRGGQCELLDAQGVAVFDPAFRLKTDSVFGMFSMTKPVVAACAAMLIAENRMSPADKVSRWIPEFAKPRRVRTPVPNDDETAPKQYTYRPAEHEITVHHILSFTSGLQTIALPNEDIPPVGPSDTLASWVAQLGDAALEAEPGTQWSYSNATGYEVLARLLEVVSGQPFPELLRERLFDPLGMRETGFGVQPWVGDRLVPLGWLASTPVARTDFPSGSAGLFSTAQDYAKFAQMLLDKGVSGGRRIMPEQAIELMTRNQIGQIPFDGVRAVEYFPPVHTRNTGVRYGYGVAIVEQPSAATPVPQGSFGWDGVGTRRCWVIPSLNTVLVMLMTGVGSDADATHREIEAAVTAAGGAAA